MRALLTAILVAFAAAGFAQSDYPSRPIRLLVTVPPGGAADFIARLVGSKLAESLGQPMVVENRAGASGTIAAEAGAQAPPHGQTPVQHSHTPPRPRPRL